MLEIAVIDDDKTVAQTVCKFLQRYENGQNLFRVTCFENALDLFSVGYVPDILFLDIEMPLVNGMEVAKRIRQTNSRTVIIFITRMAQYAIQGYDVQATAYLLKPIIYDNFCIHLKKSHRDC